VQRRSEADMCICVYKCVCVYMCAHIRLLSALAPFTALIPCNTQGLFELADAGERISVKGKRVDVQAFYVLRELSGPSLSPRASIAPRTSDISCVI
jgi:hypothetical protein